MRTVVVQRELHSPAHLVFDQIADPAAYLGFPGVTRARLLQPGPDHPHGVGAVREIAMGRVRFIEEIVAYDRPSMLGYQVIRSTPPSEHEHGSVTFKVRDGRTIATWRTTFRIRMPLMGRLATRIAARRLARAFDDALRIADARAHARTA
jgi:hypothetical protein